MKKNTLFIILDDADDTLAAWWQRVHLCRLPLLRRRPSSLFFPPPPVCLLLLADSVLADSAS